MLRRQGAVTLWSRPFSDERSDDFFFLQYELVLRYGQCWFELAVITMSCVGAIAAEAVEKAPGVGAESRDFFDVGHKKNEVLAISLDCQI